MELHDKKKSVRITMKEWNGNDWGCDLSNDIFQLVEGQEVDDVEYCIDYANDWCNSQGDFAQDIPDEELPERMVEVKEL